MLSIYFNNISLEKYTISIYKAKKDIAVLSRHRLPLWSRFIPNKFPAISSNCLVV